ncbi:hypothetical protein B296_00021531, partial [Ensete ventricosum]
RRRRPRWLAWRRSSPLASQSPLTALSSLFPLVADPIIAPPSAACIFSRLPFGPASVTFAKGYRRPSGLPPTSKAFYYEKKAIMSNEEFDNLKEELMWEGSSVVMLSMPFVTYLVSPVSSLFWLLIYHC